MFDRIMLYREQEVNFFSFVSFFVHVPYYVYMCFYIHFIFVIYMVFNIIFVFLFLLNFCIWCDDYLYAVYLVFSGKRIDTNSTNYVDDTIMLHKMVFSTMVNDKFMQTGRKYTFLIT